MKVLGTPTKYVRVIPPVRSSNTPEESVYLALRIAKKLTSNKSCQTPYSMVLPWPWLHDRNRPNVAHENITKSSILLGSSICQEEPKIVTFLREALGRDKAISPSQVMQILDSLDNVVPRISYTGELYAITLFEDPVNAEFIRLHFFREEIPEILFHTHVNPAISYVLRGRVVQSIAKHKDDARGVSGITCKKVLIDSSQVGPPKITVSKGLENAALMPKSTTRAEAGTYYHVPTGEPHCIHAMPGTITLFHALPRPSPQEVAVQYAYRPSYRMKNKRQEGILGR